MEILNRLFKRLVGNPNTSLPAIAAVLSSGIAISHNPHVLLEVLMDPTTANVGPVATLLSGIGLLFAADAKDEKAKSKPVDKPELDSE